MGSRVPQTLLAWVMTTARVVSCRQPARAAVSRVPSRRQGTRVNRDAVGLQLPQGTHYGIVFHGGDQHMISRAQKALEQHIEALRHISG